MTENEDLSNDVIEVPRDSLDQIERVLRNAESFCWANDLMKQFLNLTTRLAPSKLTKQIQSSRKELLELLGGEYEQI
jgi:hypothetical protein